MCHIAVESTSALSVLRGLPPACVHFQQVSLGAGCRKDMSGHMIGVDDVALIAAGIALAYIVSTYMLYFAYNLSTITITRCRERVGGAEFAFY